MEGQSGKMKDKMKALENPLKTYKSGAINKVNDDPGIGTQSANAAMTDRAGP